MTVISGRKGKEGGHSALGFSFLFCDRRGGCLFLEVTYVGWYGGITTKVLPMGLRYLVTYHGCIL